MSLRCAALLAFCSFVLAGCVTLHTPVGTTVGLDTDAALIGDWKGAVDENKGTLFVHVLPSESQGLVAFVVIRRKDNDGGSMFVLRTAILGRNHFANLYRMLDSDE